MYLFRVPLKEAIFSKFSAEGHNKIVLIVAIKRKFLRNNYKKYFPNRFGSLWL